MVAKFNGAVTTAATFAVTGPMVASPTVTWNTTKTEATLKVAGSFLDGIYTVKVTADGISTTSNTATVNVAANGIAKVEILGDKLIRTSDFEGYAFMKLTDSYGNDVTEKMSYDVTINHSRNASASVSIDNYKTGKIKITLGNNALVSGDRWVNYPVTPELVTLTVYSKTAVNGAVASASKTLTVTELARAAKIELAQPTFQSAGTTKVVMKKTLAAYIEVKAYDQFDNLMTGNDAETRLANTATSDVYYSISDSQVTVAPKAYTDTNGVDKTRLEVSTTSVTEPKNVTITAVSRYKGGVSNMITLNIKQLSAPEKISLLAPAPVAVGDTYTESLVVPIIAFDEDGVQLTTDQIVDASIANPVLLNVTANTDFTSLKIATTGDNKGKIVGTVAATTKRNTTITLNAPKSKTQTTANVNFEIRERAYARTIQLAKTPESYLISGGTAKYKLAFIDQYNRKMEKLMLAYTGDPANLDTNAQTVKVTFTADAGVGSLSVNGNPILTNANVLATNLVDDDMIQVTGGNLEGAARVKFELYNKYKITEGFSNSLETTFTVPNGVPSDLTLDTEAIPTLYAAFTENAAHTYALEAKANATDDMYARKINVVGKDAAGNTYAIPASKIISVSSSDPTLLGVANVAGEAVDVTDHTNNIVVWGNKLKIGGAISTFNAGETTKTATITITVGTLSGNKTVTKTVTISNAVQQVVSLKLIDLPLASNYELPTDWKSVTEVVNNALTLDATPFHIITVDQYGIYKEVVGNTESNTNLWLAKETVATLDLQVANTSGTTTLQNKVTATFTNTAPGGVVNAVTRIDPWKLPTTLNTAQFASDKFVILSCAKGTASALLNVKVSNGVLDVTAPTVVTATTKMLTATTFQVTFSEAVNAIDTDFTAYSYDADGAGAGAAVSLAVVSITGTTTNTIVVTTAANAAYVAGTGTAAVTIGSTVLDNAGNAFVASVQPVAHF